MKKEITIYTCDICKSEIPKDTLTVVTYPVRFITEQTEGRPCEPYISPTKLDLCPHCLRKVIKIEACGAQGYNTYKIVEGDNE